MLSFNFSASDFWQLLDNVLEDVLEDFNDDFLVDCWTIIWTIFLDLDTLQNCFYFFYNFLFDSSEDFLDLQNCFSSANLRMEVASILFRLYSWWFSKRIKIFLILCSIFLIPNVYSACKIQLYIVWLHAIGIVSNAYYMYF